MRRVSELLRTWLLRGSAALSRAIGRRRHDDAPERVLAAARTVMRAKKYCVLVTEGDAGPDARVVQPFRPNDDFVVHLGTAPWTRKARQVAASGQAVLVYERDRDGACVVARGAARLIEDQEVKRRYFMPMWRSFWPAGPESDDFVVIRCEIRELEVWDARRAITPEPFGLRSARLVRTDGTWHHATET